MSAPWSQEWFDECQKYYGKVLSGVYSHWCPAAHDMPVDETDRNHFGFCSCFDCKCGTRMEPKYYPFGREPLELHDDFFICPKRRFWNFWKHPIRDKYNRQWKI